MKSYVNLKYTILILLTLNIVPAVRGQTTQVNRAARNYRIVISGHWNSLDNRRLNDLYIEKLYSGDDKINSGYGISTELRYYLSSKISVSGGIIYISGSSIIDRTVISFMGSDTVNTEDYVKTRLFAPTFSIRYHIYRDKAEFSLGVSESFLFGKASRFNTVYSRSPGIFELKNDFYSNGIGFQFFVGLQYNINGLLSYMMETGYRKFQTGDLLEDETDLVLRYGFGTDSQPVNLDYSGPFISAGLMFRLF